MKTVQELQHTVFDALKDEYGFKSPMQTPKITRVSVSSGIGKIRADKRKVEIIEDRLAKITGQKPAVAKAKKSIATFKIREGEVAAYKINLTGKRALSFVDKLIHVALPRTKDFRGLKRSSVDEMGNLTIGVKEHTIFPETGDEELRDIFGLSITIGTTATNKEEAIAFFEHIGIPFRKEEEATS
tara:strand:+ start:209 stop:763 length:555 start_codon:yes stop_codon:yes gene_type:complete